MANFENGVKRYIVGVAQVKNFFPVDFKDRADICCKQCRFFRHSSCSCALNDELCAYPNQYVGQNCPLEMFIEEGEK